MTQLLYDKTSAQSILDFAFPLTGHRLRDFLSDDEQKQIVENNKNKGDLGNLVEKYYFRINPGNSKLPDFPEAGVELKTSAVLPRKRVPKNVPTGATSKYYAKERLKLTRINYKELGKETWGDNSLFKKVDKILLLLSLYEAGVRVIDRRFVAHPIMWSLSDKDLEFIKNDWEIIVGKIRASKAHELSGSDTLYLEACTSGTGSMVGQFNSDVEAIERSFAFKASFVTNSMMADAKFVEELEPVVTKVKSVAEFESIVLGRTKPFEGKTPQQIADELGVALSKAKHRLALLSIPMLGLKSRNAEEFVKAGIEIKTVNLKHNGTPSQDVSFPAFNYMDIVNEEWEDSVFNQKLDTKVLFMIFQTDKNGSERFVKSAFWSMPEADFDEAKRVWEETKQRVINAKANSLPTKKFGGVAHVRNHARNSKPENRIPSPYNGKLAQKGFWLNALYIKDQIAALL